MLKLAVTGASGSVGTAIVARALRDGHHVRAIDTVAPKVRLEGEDGRYDPIQADLSDYDRVLAVLRGCDAVIHGAAIPSPGGHPDHIVHNLNVTLSYNVLRACAELGITRVCQLSSINAIGSAYTPYKVVWDSLPLDETSPARPADTYALSKLICEIQADSLVRSFPTLRIASMRLHHALDGPQAVTDEDRRQPLEERWACQSGANDLWGWVSKDAVAQACLASLTLPADEVFASQAHEVFYLVAPTTKADGDERATSSELARRCCTESRIRPGWFEQGGAHRSFYDTSKAERLLGWVHA